MSRQDRFAQLALIFGILLPIYSHGWQVCPKDGTRGQFSNAARDLCFQNIDQGKRHLEIPSPDHSLLLVVDGENAKVKANGRPIRSFTVARDEEVIWSPDSKALIFTASLGAAGPVSADFDSIHQPRVSVGPNLAEEIRKDFSSRHLGDTCYTQANVAGLSWFHDSKAAVFVAEVPPSPQCEKSGGYFDAYVISFPYGRIVKRYSMKEAIAHWRKAFGKRLVDDIDLFKDEQRPG
jgi:hypothetical protein